MTDPLDDGTATPGGEGGGPGETGVFARRVDGLDRAIEIGTASGRLISVSFPETVPDDADGDHPVLDRIADYLAGAEDDFADVAVAITVPTAHREVLESLRNVPYGDAADVELLVRMTAGLDHEDDADLDTARAALRANPLPVVIPDHRVRDAAGATPESVAARLREIEGIHGA
ncbi:methylated-DNA--[protein]-cysteine S-methyltransferase [Halobaculum lipolyticum]|uniref:Methylated-DNA--[protein]-cysteine S-methyltransferase n=1 Tax=Halobaculum lipolyticum TaxID=3032001 RepID=A0ABD5WBU7_9EURY|nr:methylated-DNA--[protein]-cysteine S-methyltransferase [Halobaculum sp. DT31]